MVVVDNSILAPVFQQPLALGADICMTSATKFIAGHSDVTAGTLSVKQPELAQRIYFYQVCSVLLQTTSVLQLLHPPGVPAFRPVSASRIRAHPIAVQPFVNLVQKATLLGYTKLSLHARAIIFRANTVTK